MTTPEPDGGSRAQYQIVRTVPTLPASFPCADSQSPAACLRPSEEKLAALEWLFSWSWHHGLRRKRLELAYCQFLSLVLEMPATFEYIDLEGPPDRLQITKIGGYPTGLGSEAGGPHVQFPWVLPVRPITCGFPVRLLARPYWKPNGSEHTGFSERNRR